MNRIAAVVKSIEDMEIVSYIMLDINDVKIRIIKSKVPEWLSVGDRVFITFKEMSACIGKACNGKVSIENKIPATPISIRANHSLCEVKFETQIGDIVSLITQHAFDELQLDIGSQVTILLRETDIHLEPCIQTMHMDNLINPRTKVAN